MSEQYSILYLDDEEDNLTSFKAVFRRNFKIYTAQHAREALELLSANAIDLVISDQRMPGISGVEFLEKIHQSYPH
ncbi:MAG TPA: response regulator, partial [Saprospiraceae bacterium]|nr:response regulator [Saprospiraceae bacterium]